MSYRVRLAALIALLAGCGGLREPPRSLPPATPGLELQPEDYAVARAAFRTRLLRRGPAPQVGEPLTSPPGAVAIRYTSGKLKLRAFVTPDPRDHRRHPAVLFLHGGYAYGAVHWEMARPYREAGYVVMVPVLRGENSQDGDYSHFYDEVDDVQAAADALAGLPYVDGEHLYVAGHSIGGTLTMLAAMATDRFRAAASISGATGRKLVVPGGSEVVPFDAADPREFRLRSPVAYATSFKCPTRLYHGDEEFLQGGSERTAGLARGRGLDVEAVEVAGDHFSCVPEAIRLSLAFFRRNRGAIGGGSRPRSRPR